jgi:hypothetical protein
LFTSGLPTFSPKKRKFWDSFEKHSGHFLDQYLDFYNVQKIFKIWVGKTVFTVTALCSAKYLKVHEAANHALFKF